MLTFLFYRSVTLLPSSHEHRWLLLSPLFVLLFKKTKGFQKVKFVLRLSAQCEYLMFLEIGKWLEKKGNVFQELCTNAHSEFSVWSLGLYKKLAVQLRY